MTRTLYIHPSNDFTGSTQVLANILEKIDDDVFVIANNRQNGCLSRLPNVHVISEFRPQINGEDIVILSGLISKIHLLYLLFFFGRNFDCFYINTIRPYYAAIVGKILRKKIIWHIHEKYVEKTFATKLYEFCFDHIKSERIFVSIYLQNQYAPRRDSPSIVKYNKLPASFVNNIKRTPIHNRKRNTVLMAASYAKKKGIYNYKRIAKILPDYNFILVMSASDEEVKLFAEKECPPNLIVYPKQSNLQSFLEKSDLMVNLSIPSLWVETFGMTILESMAYGVPSIAPNVGGPLELIENGVNGFCVDVTNLEKVAETIQYCLNKDNYDRLVSGCLKLFKKFE